MSISWSGRKLSLYGIASTKSSRKIGVVNEEIVILLAGKMQAVVGDKLSSCDAPCTIILPANESHVLKNIGDVPTNHYLVMPIKSKIVDMHSNEMILRWRK